MVRYRSALGFVSLAATLACGPEPTSRGGVEPAAPLPTRAPGASLEPRWEPVAAPALIPLEAEPAARSMPAFGGGGPFFSASGSSPSQASSTSGGAHFSQAPVIDFYAGGAWSPGGGSFQGIVTGGVSRSQTSIDSVAGVVPDDTGALYLVLALYDEAPQPTGVVIGTVLYVVVPVSDFAPGASVQLDGWDRFALFGRGDVSLPQPQEIAAAVTGTITFTAGGVALGDLIDADLSADFVEYAWPAAPTGAGLSPGAYTLSIDPSPYVYCDGALSGQEAAFLGTTTSTLGLAAGPVTITGPNNGFYDIAGAPIANAYGVGSLTLETQAGWPPDVYAAIVAAFGAGPAGTHLFARYLVVDGSSGAPLYGWAGLGYMTPAQDGYCSVDWMVELAP